MSKLSLKLPVNPIESFALSLAVARIERIVSPIPAANSNPKILHTPATDALLIASSIRANTILSSVLAHLTSRDAVISTVIQVSNPE